MTWDRAGNSQSSKLLSSLRDILLKTTVMNFERIFFDDNSVRNRELKKGILLPPCLFEDIQHKGRQIGWNIPAQFLKPCLPCRDALNWVKVSLLHGHYEIQDLVEVGNSKLPLREFSFRSHRITQELFEVIQRFSPTLEILYVGRLKADDKDKNNSEDQNFHAKFDERKLIFPELRKLSINFLVLSSYALVNADLRSCSNKLESLELNYFGFYHVFFEDVPHATSFVGNIREMKALKSLSMLLLNRNYKLLENIQWLGNLRSLTFMTMKWSLSENDYVDQSPCNVLENPSDSIMLEKFTQDIKLKNLKYFNGVRLQDNELIENQLGKITGVSSDSLLTKFDYSLFNEEFSSTIGKPLIGMLKVIDLNLVTKNQWQSLEKVILIFMERYWTENGSILLNYAKTIYEMAQKAKWTWSSEFLEKFVNLIVNFESYEKNTDIKSLLRIFEVMKSSQILNFMLNHVKKNPKTTRSEMFINQFIRAGNETYLIES